MMDQCERPLLTGLLFAAMGLNPCAHAEGPQAGYGLRVGVGKTDNVDRAAQDETDETIATAGAQFWLSRESRRLQADAVGDFSYLDYLDDTYDDEVVGSFVGQAVLGIVPERIEWRLADTFGQVTQQPFAAVTPENREDVNYFKTGPRIVIGANSALQVQLNGNYSNVRYETSPLDNERYGADMAVVRQLSRTSALSLNLRHEEVDFDDDLVNTDIELREAFVKYKASGARLQAGLELGYTEVEREQETGTGLLARMELSRRVSPSSTLSASVGREFSEAGNIFQQLQSLQSVQSGAGGTQSVQLTSDPFTSTYGTLGWYFDRNRTGFGVTASRFEEEYEQQSAFDRTRTSFGASVWRDLAPHLQLRAHFERNGEKSQQSSQDFNEVYATAVLAWGVGVHTSIELQYERFDRSSTIEGAEYTENRGWLRVAFSGGSRREGSGAAPIPTGSYR